MILNILNKAFFQKKSIVYLLLSFGLSLNAFAQVKNLGLPYFTNYSSEDYKASKQNWIAVQDHRGVLYVGNTMGVLEFDGHDWRLIKLGGSSRIVRALKTGSDNRVYVGADGTFGYLAPDSIGKMTYLQLNDKIENKGNFKFAGINKIFELNGKIFYATDNIMFEYDQNSVKGRKIEGLRNVAEIGGRVFMKMSQKGIFEWKNQQLIELKCNKNIKTIKDISLRTALSYEKDKILFLTMEHGLFLYDNNEVNQLKTPTDNFFKKNKILSAINLGEGNYAFGTLSKGLVITDKNGKVIQHITTELGLQSGLVSNILQTQDGNLWLSTWNGLTYLMSSLPLTKFDKNYALNSTVYSTLLYDDILYVASSVGLYKRIWGETEKHLNQIEAFEQVGEPYNVWNLDTINNSLLAPTNRGVNEIKNGKLKKLKAETNAFWKFLRINNNENFIIAGTRKGLKLLEYKTNKSKKKGKKKKGSNGSWVFKKNISGYDSNCRHIEIDKQNNIWLTDKTKGVFKLIPTTASFDSVSVQSYNSNKGLADSLNNFVFKIKNEIVIASNNGLYLYDKTNDTFIEHKKFNQVLGKDVKIHKMLEDNDGDIWYKQERKEKHSNEDVFEMGQLILQEDGSYLNYKTPFYKFKNNIHSINPIENGSVMIGTRKGVVHYDPKIEKDYSVPYNSLVRKVEFVNNDSLLFDGAFVDSTGLVVMSQQVDQIYKIPYLFNDLRFTFSSPYFDSPEQIKFKFFLEGNDDTWSDWKTKNFKEYSNLSEGEYTFRVKAINLYGIESEEASYSFAILPPWYRTAWAIAGYFVLAILLIWGIVRLSVRRLRKQKEHLEEVVEERTAEIRMKNTALEQQKEEILAQRDEIEEQKNKIEEKNKNITASITYAQRIQEAMLPLKDKIEQTLDDYFILFKPRDIVSGDFYWFAEKNNKIIFTAVDCTGHGVPGAFMSMIGSEILTTIVNQGITQPSEILDYKNRYVRKALKQEQTENQDGMDMSLCTIDKLHKKIEWAGAKNPLVYIKKDELFHIKGDMQSIGGHQLIKKKETKFTNHTLSFADAPTYFYIFSDGFQDQFGGPKGRKFMVKRMKELIYENHKKPMQEQHAILNAAIDEWKKNAEQTDDILVIGFKLVP